MRIEENKMKQELQDKLFEKYPRIFAQKDLSMQETCMCWGITAGDGWYNILDVLCYNIQFYLDQKNAEGEFKHLKKYLKDDYKVIPQLEAVQVKEKFGGLRFYADGGDEFVSGLIRMAEAIAFQTCEECGAIGSQNTEGWIHTLCNCCRENYDKIRAERIELSKNKKN
jgi:hypothetical protein